MRCFILLAFFAALAFGGELADLSKECKKGNDEICKRLSFAIKNLELACDEGGEKNAMYCAGLGYFYEFDKVFTKAVRYYDRACGLGADKACVYLGLLYQSGQGAAQDHKKANELFAKACEKGVGEETACYNLALSYALGGGVEKDAAKAAQMYAASCERGHVDSCADLGVCYFKGDGVERDYERAVVLFTNACSGASALACANLGFTYEKGMGVEKNKNAAKELYDRGCKLGEFSACQYLKNLR